MSRAFAETARQLSGQTALLLGWRPSDFWSATPAELATIFSAFGEAQPPALDRNAIAALMERNPDG